MRTPRERGPSQPLDVYPQRQECPECHPPMHERSHKQRWIVRLEQHVQGVRHFLECAHTACTRPAGVYRPYQEDAWAWRGSTCGWDVVARMGAWRYRDHVAIPKMRDPLQPESDLSSSLQEVALWCEVFLALVTPVVQHDEELMAQLHTFGGLILAIDGVQPEKSPETRSRLRDVRSGRVFGAKTRLSRATADMEPWLAAVHGLGRPILGVISDQQEAIGWAVEPKLPMVPPQLGHLHSLKAVAPPLCEAARPVKKELQQKIRGIRDLERQAANSSTQEAQVVAHDGLALRTVMRDEGTYPLEPPGLQRYQKLQLLAASVERVMARHPSALLKRL
jgi:hypothetical protein